MKQGEGVKEVAVKENVVSLMMQSAAVPKGS